VRERSSVLRTVVLYCLSCYSVQANFTKVSSDLPRLLSEKVHMPFTFISISLSTLIKNVLRLESAVNVPRKNKSFNSARLLLLIITTKLMLMSIVIGVSE